MRCCPLKGPFAKVTEPVHGKYLTAVSRRKPMAKKQTDSVYRIVDVVGVSEKSWEEAGRRAVETAASSLRDLRVAEVTKMDMRVENGKVIACRTRVALSFKYEA